MAVLICGSLAYDSILRYDGRFRDDIVPSEETDQLNVSFLAHDLRREFGGVAGNIAYNLTGLGQPAYPMSSVGQDFEPYQAWMTERGIDQTYVAHIADRYTPQAYITTDQVDNQITLFHPGAMEHNAEQHIPTDADIRIGVVSPESRDAMCQHAAEMHAAGIPIFFDPGQGMTMFERDELLGFLEQARWMAVNDYEHAMLQKKTGLTDTELLDRLEIMLVTRGGEGSDILRSGKEPIHLPPSAVTRAVDPTGCGDAYRAGVLYGMLRDWNWEECGRLGTVLGGLAVEHEGCQNHTIDWATIRDRAAALGGLPD